MSFSEEFERCSPGTLLLVETIRYAAKAGLRSYEFLGGDENWIRPWTQSLRPCVSIRAFPFSIGGALAMGSDASAIARDRAREFARGVRQIPVALERRLAASYVAGPKVSDATRECRSLQAARFRSTIGYSSADGDSPRGVAASYMATIDAIHVAGLDSYVSVKAPLLAFSPDLLREVAALAARTKVRIHFDALAEEDTDKTFSLIDQIRTLHSNLGCTLPGRWERSVRDADRAIASDLAVRVVKGEWVARSGNEQDPRAGFLSIVDRIAGRVRHAAVATHDPYLAHESLRRLAAAGTPCELEVLMGYPVQRVLPIAQRMGVPVRFYVPFGYAALPYALRQAPGKPRIALWALRDLMKGANRRSQEVNPFHATELTPDHR